MFNAIKAAILKGNEVEYWALRMYEQQEAGVLTDKQVAELEVLIDEYYNPPVVESVDETESVDDSELSTDVPEEITEGD